MGAGWDGARPMRGARRRAAQHGDGRVRCKRGTHPLTLHLQLLRVGHTLQLAAAAGGEGSRPRRLCTGRAGHEHSNRLSLHVTPPLPRHHCANVLTVHRVRQHHGDAGAGVCYAQATVGNALAFHLDLLPLQERCRLTCVLLCHHMQGDTRAVEGREAEAEAEKHSAAAKIAATGPTSSSSTRSHMRSSRCHDARTDRPPPAVASVADEGRGRRLARLAGVRECRAARRRGRRAGKREGSCRSFMKSIPVFCAGHIRCAGHCRSFLKHTPVPD